MLRITNPGYLWLSLLLVAALLLYLFRRRARPMEVSTLLFFMAPAADRRDAPWLRQVRKWLSYVLTAAAILCGVLALARLSWSGGEEETGPVLLLVDRSASMGARRGGGKTVWDETQKQLRARIHALPDGVPVSVIAYDARPVFVQPPTTSRRELFEALSALGPRDLPGDAPAAKAFAALQAGRTRGSRVWHVSAEPDAEGEKPAAPLIRATDEAAVNAGITAFALRSRPLQPGERELFLRVKAYGPGEPPGSSADVRLEIRVNGGLMQLRQIEIPWGGSETLVLPLRLAAGSRLEAMIELPGDALASDNRVEAWAPEEAARQAAWVSEDPDPFVEVALAAIASAGRLGFVRLTPEAWDPADPRWSLAVFDGWLPDEKPEIPAVLIDPPARDGWIKVERLPGPLPRDRLRPAVAEHPVLFRVPSGRAGVAQTARVTPGPGLEPLWIAGDDPVLLAGMTSGTPLVVMGFSPRRSDRLPFGAAFPLLLGNALYWCAASKGTGAEDDAAVLATGTILDARDAQEEGRAPLRWLSGASTAVDGAQHAGEVVELDRVGLWESAGGRRGSAALLSAEETRQAAGSRVTGAPTPLRSRLGDVSAAFLSAALVMLLLESWLFHRRGVY